MIKRIGTSILSLGLLACMTPAVNAAVTFDDGGTHNFSDSAFAIDDGNVVVSEGSVVNFLPGSAGNLTLNDDSVVNVQGGAIGGDPGGGYNNVSHIIRHQSVLNFYSGNLYRRFYSIRNDATVNIFGDGDFAGEGGSGGLGGLDAFQLNNNATIVLYAAAGYDLNNVVIDAPENPSTWNAPFDVTLLLANGTEEKTLGMVANGSHNLSFDTGEGYVLDYDYVNIGGPIQEGFLNIVNIPEPGTMAMIGIGAAVALVRRRRA